ncbi:MAG: hypothetical protein K1X47_02475 [Cyclobacteriaceae bacterium]|nr:hypothetical protein [Cyclobacteriaceae bacterium]
MNRSLTTLLLILMSPAIWAQTEGTLTLMNSLPQVVYTNPAAVPRYRFSLGLPGSSLLFSYTNNGFSYSDMVKTQNGVVTADLNKFNNALKPRNYITMAAQADLFRFSLKVSPRFYLTVNATAKAYNRLMIPKDLMSIFINGNVQFIGSSAVISPRIESTTMLETGFGGAYTVNKNLRVGARIKILKGVSNITTQSANLNIAVAPDNYAVTATADLDVRSSGIYNFSQSNFDFGNSYKDYLSNNGYAFDLGATYRLFDRLNLGASLLDIGSIKWSNNTYGYTLSKSDASYTFPGVDLNQILNGNSAYLDHEGDTLQKRFKPKEGVIPSYRTTLPGKMYLTAQYELRRNFIVGAAGYAERYQGRLSAGLTLGVNKNFGRRLTLSGSYTISNNSYNNLGAGMSINAPPFQFYLLGDNLLNAALSANHINQYLNNLQTFNLRMGLNFVFGWDRPETKQNGSVNSPDYGRKNQ